jgi:hypothetical protein
MFITLVVLSLANVKNETPVTKTPKLQCLNPARNSPKLEPTNDTGTSKCIAVPEPSPRKPTRVGQ